MPDKFTNRAETSAERFRDAERRYGRQTAFRMLQDDLRVIWELQYAREAAEARCAFLNSFRGKA